MGIVNVDLLSVGIAVATNAILGFIVFFRERRNATNALFLVFTLVNTGWSIFNYISYQTGWDPFRLLFIRFVMFFAVLQAFSFFLLMHTFPQKNVNLSQKEIIITITVVAGTALLTLTRFIFSEIQKASPGQVSQPVPGQLILLFAAVAIYLVVAGILTLIKKIVTSQGVEHTQFKYLATGVVLMFALIIGFNFVFPVFFENTYFIPLSATFTLPFSILTAYAIIKHGLLNIKVVATEILTFVLVIAIFLEIIFATELSIIIFRSSVFLLILSFGILLIRSVRKEVEQRERMEVLTKQLEEANEELKKLDAAKSEFISIASHQLRAPLTVIRGFVSLVIEGSYGAVSDQIKEALGKVAYSTVQLVKLVSDLLNLSRIEAGKIRYEMKQSDFLDTVTKVVEEFRPNAEKKGLRLAFVNNAGAIPSFVFDADKIREAVVNLTDNAIKYSTQGEVKITLEKSAPDRVRLSVKDTGIGVSKEDLPRLFTKFIRTEDARLHDPNGMGIGLYFVKRVLDDHGGRVGVESEGLGKGSTFWVELPIK